MKITHNKVGQNLNVTDSKKTDKSDKAGSADNASKLLDTKESDSSSKVQLSSRAQDMKRIKELAQNAPDVDEAKVARLQKMIDEGKYKVDSEAIADKMVDEHLMFS